MPANEVVLSLLSQASLSGGVPADDLEACAAAFEKMHFAKGNALFLRGNHRKLAAIARPGLDG
jgi:hypothetical protein